MSFVTFQTYQKDRQDAITGHDLPNGKRSRAGLGVVDRGGSLASPFLQQLRYAETEMAPRFDRFWSARNGPVAPRPGTRRGTPV